MLIDIQTIRILLWLNEDDTSLDNKIEIFYNNAVAYIENYIWYKLEEAEYIDEKDWNWEKITSVKNIPLRSIEKIEWKLSTDWSLNDYEEISNKDYTYKTNWELFFNSNLSRWYKMYKISYTAWYTSLNLDNSLAMILQDLIVSFYNQNDIDNNKVVSESVDWASISFMKSFNYMQDSYWRVNVILDKFKKYEF